MKSKESGSIKYSKLFQTYREIATDFLSMTTFQLIIVVDAWLA